MDFLDYFKHITVEDLVDYCFLAKEEVLKTSYGYLINSGCGISSSPQIIYLPFNDFRIFICCEPSCYYHQSFINGGLGSNETDEIISKMLKRNALGSPHDIFDFVVHISRLDHENRNEAALDLIKALNIDIPADVFKQYFLK